MVLGFSQRMSNERRCNRLNGKRDLVLLELGITENIHVMETIMNITNRVVVMMLLDGRG